MSALPLPERVDDIDARWLTAALRDGGWNKGQSGVEVSDVAVDAFGEGTAFLGSLARLTPTYSSGSTPGPVSLIAKLPTSNEGAHAVGRMLNVWFREAMFYAHLAPDLPGSVSVPRCRFNDVHDETGHAVLILDDAVDASTRDQVVGATAAEARSAVLALARYQAIWWGKPRTEQLDWVPGLDRIASGEGLKSAMLQSLDQFEHQFGTELPAASVAWNRSFIVRLDVWIRDIASGPLTIGHGDYRLENLLFHEDGQITIIDWQTAMYTAGATDLAFLLGTSIEVETRRQHEADLLDVYLDELKAGGVDPALLGHVRRDYRSSMLWWMAILGNNLATIDPADKRGVELFTTMLGRLHSAAVDLEVGEFVD